MSNHYIGFTVTRGGKNNEIIKKVNNQQSTFNFNSNQMDPYSYFQYYNLYGQQNYHLNTQGFSNYTNNHLNNNNQINNVDLFYNYNFNYIDNSLFVQPIMGNFNSLQHISQPQKIFQINDNFSIHNQQMTLTFPSTSFSYPQPVPPPQPVPESDQRPPSPLILNNLQIADLYNLNRLYFKSGTSLTLKDINTYSFYLLNLEPDQIFKIDEYNNIYLLEFNKEIGMLFCLNFYLLF